MKGLIGVNKVIAEDYLWDIMDENKVFNKFVGDCITHFVRFVVPRRDQTKEIAQDYAVPLSIDDVGGDRLLLVRKDNSNEIFIDFWR